MKGVWCASLQTDSERANTTALTGSGFGTQDSGQISLLVASFYGGEAQSDTASSQWTSDSSVIVLAPPGLGCVLLHPER